MGNLSKIASLFLTLLIVACNSGQNVNPSNSGNGGNPGPQIGIAQVNPPQEASPQEALPQGAPQEDVQVQSYDVYYLLPTSDEKAREVIRKYLAGSDANVERNLERLKQDRKLKIARCVASKDEVDQIGQDIQMVMQAGLINPENCEIDAQIDAPDEAERREAGPGFGNNEADAPEDHFMLTLESYPVEQRKPIGIALAGDTLFSEDMIQIYLNNTPAHLFKCLVREDVAKMKIHLERAGAQVSIQKNNAPCNEEQLK